MGATIFFCLSNQNVQEYSQLENKNKMPLALIHVIKKVLENLNTFFFGLTKKVFALEFVDDIVQYLHIVHKMKGKW